MFRDPNTYNRIIQLLVGFAFLRVSGCGASQFFSGSGLGV